jgi:hypothetical protein
MQRWQVRPRQPCWYYFTYENAGTAARKLGVLFYLTRDLDENADVVYAWPSSITVPPGAPMEWGRKITMPVVANLTGDFYLWARLFSGDSRPIRTDLALAPVPYRAFQPIQIGGAAVRPPRKR